MGNNYVMEKYEYHRTIPKMQNILANWRQNAHIIARTFSGDLYFSQKCVLNADKKCVTLNTNIGGGGGVKHSNIFHSNCYNCNKYGHQSID